MTAPNPARLSSAQLEYAFTERARLEAEEALLLWIATEDEAATARQRASAAEALRPIQARLAEIQAALDADERARWSETLPDVPFTAPARRAAA